MADKAKHAYGSRKNLEAAIASGAIDAYDVLFLNGEGETPAIGWMDKDGKPVIVETDLSGIEADISALEGQIATKADAKEIDAKINAAIDEHLARKYEITDVPIGTLVDIHENEIRIMCPKNAEFTKQSVGTGGDSNTYYMTFKTYVLDDNVVGYREHLGNQVDNEILTDLKTDEYGRRYQLTWLGLAKYDEATDTWSYYGANSTVEKYTGWNYQIDWYDADGVMIASDSIRINLSNEACHSVIEPYYVGSMMAEVDKKIAKATAGAIEVIEF